MQYLHKLNILHRDLKPTNLLLYSEYKTSDNAIRIADFGLACISSMIENPAPIVGSYNYLSPEILLSDIPHYSKSSDIYSFALTLWQIVSQSLQSSIYDNMTSLDQIKEAIKNGVRPAIPESVSPTLRKLLQASWSDLIEARPSFDQIFSDITANALSSTLNSTIRIVPIK